MNERQHKATVHPFPISFLRQQNRSFFLSLSLPWSEEEAEEKKKQKKKKRLPLLRLLLLLFFLLSGCLLHRERERDAVNARELTWVFHIEGLHSQAGNACVSSMESEITKELLDDWVRHDIANILQLIEAFESHANHQALHDSWTARVPRVNRCIDLSCQ